MSDSTEEPKHYLVAHIRESLAKDPRVGELNVDVAVAGKKVVLTGQVATDERRKLITQVVTELLPDHEVANQTVVRTYPETEEVERLR